MTESLWLQGTLLSRLSDSTRRRLLTLGIPRTAAASRVIIQEGMNESHVILLNDGLTKVTVAMADGRHALLDVRVSGDLVGEISALNGTPRSATVTTCRASAIRIIQRNDFRSFLRDHPDAAMAIAGIVADRLRLANRRRVDFASYPVKVRLARILWEIAMAYGYRQDDGIVVDIQLTQSELATMCGAAEITLQKALRELRATGIVDTGYRQVVVRNAAALQSCADAL
ncbi:Crp/Fnr family transcriptional regulator [Actinoplanes xinjiangensis]|uniref:CRP-like cAMP-binding protein n=1 Tax=Actinoplanes xinjiangensis TaxID=512350 RepID=A0A316F7F8_9ACTN|nr:Crp/Fnr family transcriptional regulator [Actinoplanes xinjiangensis]PWK42681.1 CRP-like cAMP-binding protein [Actinoplanes xinjiangensis]GIF38242.1 Crp/Fnr family transcriptional regulator [Actinoplanes xinjiangensis]